jgi:hypothetical protein
MQIAERFCGPNIYSPSEYYYRQAWVHIRWAIFADECVAEQALSESFSGSADVVSGASLGS